MTLQDKHAETEVPKGYRLEHSTFSQSDYATKSLGAIGILKNVEADTSFLLSNRRWEMVNRSFGKMPEQIAKRLARVSTAENPARILDIGAGAQFRASNELAHVHRKKRDRVKVFGIDLTVASDAPNDAHRILGDALHLPIKDGSIDMAYSRQSIVYIAQERPEVMRQSLDEVARVLKPGGIFFIDFDVTDDESTFMPPEVVTPDGTSLYWGRHPSLASPRVRLGDTLSGRKYDFRFTAMVKGDPAHGISSLIEAGGLTHVYDGEPVGAVSTNRWSQHIDK